MNNIHIKNRGSTQTYLQNGKKCECNPKQNNKYNQIDWDIDYDGQRANIDMNITNNQDTKHLDFQLTNDDLADILNIPSFSMPLEERLTKDFQISDKDQSIPIDMMTNPMSMQYAVEPVPMSMPMYNPVPMSMQHALLPKTNSFESLIIPLKLKTTKKRKPRVKTSSIRRRLLTPRPKTMRIILRPKTTSSFRKRKQSSRH